MAKLAEIEYDEDNDILYVGDNRKAEDSLKVDNFVIDFAHGDEMIGVEVFNASKVIKGMNQDNSSKQVIKSFKIARIHVYKGKELAFFVITFYADRKLTEPLSVLQIPKPIMAMA